MQSFFEARSAARSSTLDTDQPSVRHIQNLIRRRIAVTLRLQGGESIEGVIRWQDIRALALEVAADEPLVLVNRDAVLLLRERA
ncbi:Hfq-related RNA-binding protein [Cyanobium sp. CH-040]|uniref:Hfq-related RNA-binding protein n=1 Tax=Cyanobium sp. CH-040 TaxID=2823708 RepID=UPI0020CF8B6E|nr:hypothetical protein [Cyanobium sp. CH-040]MCP9927016.1 hypothetical protein [Cyanobium sp. CH-040]